MDDSRDRSRLARIFGIPAMVANTNEEKLEHEDLIRVLLRERFQREVSQLQLHATTAQY